MKTILVPTDFSKPAQVATEVAAGIAKKMKAELILLHVVEQASDVSFNVEGETSPYVSWEERLITLKLVEKARRQLAKIKEEFSHKSVEVSTILRVGTPYHGMHTILVESQVDLVVMGTSGRSKLEEVVIGSNTQKIVRRALCPVLSLHERPTTTDFKSIVYATSMQKEEEVFSRFVQKTQEIYGCMIHLVHVNTPGLFASNQSAKKKMEEYAKKMRLKNYTTNVYNDYSEEAGIIQFAKEVKADMIALATHGRTGIARMMAGSIAEGVVNHSRIPILTCMIGKNRSRGERKLIKRTS